MITKTKVTVYVAEWVKFDFCEFNDGFIRARSNMKDKLNKCLGCESKFNIGDMVNIASFGNKGNKVLCRVCADDIQSKINEAMEVEKGSD